MEGECSLWYKGFRQISGEEVLFLPNNVWSSRKLPSALLFDDLPVTSPGQEAQEDNINCLPPLILLKHEDQDPCIYLSSRKSPSRGQNLAEVVGHQLLHGSTLQSGTAKLAVLHMVEQFIWEGDVTNMQWDRYWRPLNREQLQRIVKWPFFMSSCKTKLAGSIFPKLRAREDE